MPDISNLSSNWKKLQEKLKSAPSKDKKDGGDQGVKRKRGTEPTWKSKDPNNPNNIDVSKKRVKVEETNKVKGGEKKKMGAAFSKAPSTNENSTRPASRMAADVPADDPKADLRAMGSGRTKRASFAGSTETLVNQGLHPSHKPGKFLALDCEMVGTGPPPSSENVLARVSIVNFHGEQVYDSYVQPPPDVEVTDYRTFVSGIRPHHLKSDVARPYEEVQKQVFDLLDGKVLVGHALKNDLAVLLLSHPQRDIRDTAKHANFRKTSMGRAPALRKLAKERLGMDIQEGEHSSVEDARATMLLFKLEKDVFEKDIQNRYGAAIRRERQMKETEAKKAMKALPRNMVDDSEDEDEEDDDDDEAEEELNEDGELVAKTKKSGPKKKKNKKKKRTKRA